MQGLSSLSRLWMGRRRWTFSTWYMVLMLLQRSHSLLYRSRWASHHNHPDLDTLPIHADPRHAWTAFIRITMHCTVLISNCLTIVRCEHIVTNSLHGLRIWDRNIHIVEIAFLSGTNHEVPPALLNAQVDVSWLSTWVTEKGYLLDVAGPKDINIFIPKVRFLCGNHLE